VAPQQWKGHGDSLSSKWSLPAIREKMGVIELLDIIIDRSLLTGVSPELNSGTSKLGNENCKAH
jgi:hypothetical protein